MELLNEDLQRELIAQPESGMGYQMLRSNYEMAKRVMEQRTTLSSYFIRESRLTFWRKLANRRSDCFMLERNELGLGKEILSLRVLRSEADVSTRVRERSSSTQSSSGASEAPAEQLQAEEKFKRFSAYANDRRVTANGGLLPGTYATTEQDAKHVKTGRDAVKRYALPNPAPAVSVLTIEPPQRTRLRRGVAQPAYGQP